MSDKVWVVGDTSRDGDLILRLRDPEPGAGPDSSSDSDSDGEGGGVDEEGEGVLPLMGLLDMVDSDWDESQ